MPHDKTCEYCGVAFVAMRSDKVFCSNACRKGKYDKANPEKMREKRRKWAEANPEKRREKERKYRKANPEKMREKRRKWAEANPEKVRATQRKCNRKKAAFKETGKLIEAIQYIETLIKGENP